MGNFTGLKIQQATCVQLSYYGVCYMKTLLGTYSGEYVGISIIKADQRAAVS